jgi:hypothetical protein
MLTDLEICKRIAEIEGLNVAAPSEVVSREYLENVCVILPEGEDHPQSYCYNPLTDKALCFDLMLTHRVSVLDCGSRWEASIDYIADVGIMSPDETCCYYTEDEDLHRAVCLAIILKDDKE